jgi:hypothetical protein
MTRRKRAIAKAAYRAPARQWLTWVALLAFFLQGLAVQTHIHPADFAPVAKLVGQHANAPAAPAKNQDPGDQCRLCQELVHAGAYVTPSAALLAAPLSIFRAIPLALLPPRSQSAPAFAWQSRAPPQS